MTPPGSRLAILLRDFHGGGVERHLLHLARGAAQAGVVVDVLTAGPPAGAWPAGVGRVALPGGGRQELLQALSAYLAQRRPDVLLSAKESDDALAVAARRRAPGATRLALLAASTPTAKLHRRNPLARWWRRRCWAAQYRQADVLLAVSRGVAADLARLVGVPRTAIPVLPNPTLAPELEQQARAPLDHPWFAPGAPPVILAMGRLAAAKDFATLLRAFAHPRAPHPAHLVILGEGRQRPRLEALARRLGLQERVWLAGHRDNPYAWLARARLFVLSSRWEGMPNALIEAMALGVPVVATDCPSGPAELLDGGRLGPLVPVGDAAGLARAMSGVLAQPPPAEVLRAAVAPFRMEAAVPRYLEALGLRGGS